jgi:hypothetical protein
MTVEFEQKLQKRLDDAIANREIQQVGHLQVFGIEKVTARVIDSIFCAVNLLFANLCQSLSSSGQDQDPAE